MNKHVYSWPLVVVGNGLNAALYSVLNRGLLLRKELGHIVPGSFLSFSDGCRCSYETVFDVAMSVIAGSGLFPVVKNLNSIRIEPGNNMLKVSVGMERLVRANYQKLVIYDLDGVAGIPFNVEHQPGITQIHETFETNYDVGSSLHFEIEGVGFHFSKHKIDVVHKEEHKLDTSTIRLYLLEYCEKTFQNAADWVIEPTSRRVIDGTKLLAATRGNIEVRTDSEEDLWKSLISYDPVDTNTWLESSQSPARDFILTCRGMTV